jgi:hypothetical protein
MNSGSDTGNKQQRFSDQIIGDKIILYDHSGPGTIRKIEIFNKEGKRLAYSLKKTKNGRYLFN